jgi:uncharacterized membrane protein HdeD (DUF308 family)
MAELYTPEVADRLKGPPRLERYWYLLTISGGIGVALGALVLAEPGRSLNALAVIAGIYLLAIAVLLMVRALSDQSRSMEGFLLGVVALIAGIVVIRHPGGSVVVVSLALGVFFIVAGAFDLARAIVGPQRLFSLVRGVVLLALGTAITSSTEISVKTLALLTGIALCAQGAVQIAESLVVRSSYHRAKH